MQKEVSACLSDCSRGRKSGGVNHVHSIAYHSPTQQGAFCSDPALSAGWEWWCIQRWVSYRGGDDGPELLVLPLTLSLSETYKETLNAPLECGRFFWKCTVAYKCLDLNRIECKKRQGWTIQKPAGTVTPRIQWCSIETFQTNIKERFT